MDKQGDQAGKQDEKNEKKVIECPHGIDCGRLNAFSALGKNGQRIVMFRCLREHPECVCAGVAPKKIEQHWPCTLHPDDKSSVEEAFLQDLKTTPILNLIYRIRTECGEYRWVDERCEVVREESGEVSHLSSAISDAEERIRALAEREKLEQQLIHSARLATIGTLVAIVAHEISTPLSVISGCADILADGDFATKSRREEVVTMLQSATERVSSILKELKNYARPKQRESDQLAPVDLHAVIKKTNAFFGELLAKHCSHIELELAAETPLVQGDVCKIEQILVNLISNSCDAIRMKYQKSGSDFCGRIVISTEESEHDVALTVSDDGIGICKETLAKIFHPYFTTKEGDKGMGLGLVICKNIMESFGGEILVSSIVGVGTKFTLVFKKKE
ncbi:MAG: PAS domain-containing protein [Oligoflexia bacterium]|nr:PAS domain-containing protein [Oligoflexia bacterium]